MNMSIENRRPISIDVARSRQTELQELKTSLFRLGYSEASIIALLGVHPGQKLTFGQLQVFDRYLLGDEDPLHAALRAFFLTLPVPRAALSEALGPDSVDLLVQIGVLAARREGDSLRAELTVFPAGDHLIITDRAYETDAGRSNLADRVMFLGADSYSITALARGFAARRVLDLCTGAGATAILAADRCDSVIGVDVNPRAVDLAELNALLNGVDRARFVCGDVYGPVEGQTFDLVTANPPFVPSPRTDAKVIYRDGGPSGEDVLSRILKGLSTHLRVGGTCVITANQVEHASVSYEDKVRGWLGSGFDVLLLSSDPVSIFDYALGHNSPRPDTQRALETAFEWIDCYRDEGIVGIRAGHMLIRRRGSPNETRVMRLPSVGPFALDQFAGGALDRLFLRLERCEAVGIESMMFTWVGDATGAKVAAPDGAFEPVELDFPLVVELDALSPDRPALAQILSSLERSGYELGEEHALDLAETLRQLYVTGILDDIDEGNPTHP